MNRSIRNLVFAMIDLMPIDVAFQNAINKEILQKGKLNAELGIDLMPFIVIIWWIYMDGSDKL